AVLPDHPGGCRGRLRHRATHRGLGSRRRRASDRQGAHQALPVARQTTGRKVTWRAVVLKRLRYPLVGLVLAALVVGYDRSHAVDWVGSTDLSLEFVAIDGDTAQPIEGADLVVIAETSRYLKKNERSFRLKTDETGVARHEILGCLCSGIESGLRFTNTRSVDVPAWLIVCGAPGYQEAEPFWIHEPPFGEKIERLGPQRDKLVVHIPLRKSQP